VNGCLIPIAPDIIFLAVQVVLDEISKLLITLLQYFLGFAITYVS